MDKCGTTAGHQAHRRKKETPCLVCKQAYNSYMREWKFINRDKVLPAKKIYHDTHKEQYARYSSRYKARKLNNNNSPYTVNEILDWYGPVCYLCEVSIDLDAPRQVGKEGWEKGLHLDHVTPLHKGGADSLDNVAPVHGLCNLQKSFS